jgi:hypothetical protein
MLTLTQGRWKLELAADGSIESFGDPSLQLLPGTQTDRHVRMEVGARRLVADQPRELRQDANRVTFVYLFETPVPLEVELSYTLEPLLGDGAALGLRVRLRPLGRILENVCLRVPANLRLSGRRHLFAPRKDGLAVRLDLSSRSPFYGLVPGWGWTVGGRFREYIGGDWNEPLAVPLVSEYVPGEPWRLTWCSDPTFSTCFRQVREDSGGGVAATGPGELNCVYLGAVGMEAPEERRFYACVHRGDERAASDAFYATALSDVPPGPDWLHDVAWVHFDYFSHGGAGWWRDVDRLAEVVAAEDRSKLCLCLQGWYDWIGIYSYDHQRRSLLPSWTAYVSAEFDPARPAADEGMRPVPLGRDEVRRMLSHARDRGFRVLLYFADGLTADSADLGTVWTPDQALYCGGWEATREHAFMRNPLHPAVRERLLGYTGALLDAFGDVLDGLVWDETYYIDPGELGPAVCPGYADRAMLTLVREIAAQCHAYRADFAFLGGDNIGVPGFEHKLPYSLVADGIFQDSGCYPGAWPYGVFPNLRNVVWSVNWQPLGHFDYTRYGVERFGAPVSTSNGFMENRGPAQLSPEEIRPIVDLFDARKRRRTQLQWLELPDEEPAQIWRRLGVVSPN